MWKLYDDLYIGIPSGIRITGCTVGAEWTTVCTSVGIGTARTLLLPLEPETYAAAFVGRYLRDTAGYINWKNLTDAAVGVAAMNAWYNTPDKIAALQALFPAREASGSAAYVGLGEGDGCFPLPMSPEFERDTYVALKDYDRVVISADALTTRALPGLLELIGEDGDVTLEGASLPATSLFRAFKMPIRALRTGGAAKIPFALNF